jgi:hypothetical protein
MTHWTVAIHLSVILVIIGILDSITIHTGLRTRKPKRYKTRLKSWQHYRHFHNQYPIALPSAGIYYYRRLWMQVPTEHWATMAMTPHDRRGMQCKVALNDEKAFTAGRSEGDLFTIIWDTGASTSVTPDLHDFAEGMVESIEPTILQGLASGL